MMKIFNDEKKLRTAKNCLLKGRETEEFQNVEECNVVVHNRGVPCCAK